MAEPTLKRLAPGQRRYIAKRVEEGRSSRWGVYDVALGSWPVYRVGVGRIKQVLKTEPEAQTEADRLEAAHELRDH